MGAEALIVRHLAHNVLGDGFTADSLVIEPVHPLGLLDLNLMAGTCARR